MRPLSDLYYDTFHQHIRRYFLQKCSPIWHTNCLNCIDETMNIRIIVNEMTEIYNKNVTNTVLMQLIGPFFVANKREKWWFSAFCTEWREIRKCQRHRKYAKTNGKIIKLDSYNSTLHLYTIINCAYMHFYHWNTVRRWKRAETWNIQFHLQRIQYLDAMLLNAKGNVN